MAYSRSRQLSYRLTVSRVGALPQDGVDRLARDGHHKVRMPCLTGIDATREITRVAPDVAVPMLTMFDDDESVFAAVAAGEAVFGPGIARRALAYLSRPHPDQADHITSIFAKLQVTTGPKPSSRRDPRASVADRCPANPRVFEGRGVARTRWSVRR